VILNDIFAYIFGFFFGKTPLIKLSPKKTWEGFIGGGVITIIWAFFASDFLTNFEYLACPQHKISLWPFDYPSCNLDPVYQSTISFSFPFELLGFSSSMVAPVQIHSFIIALFACTLGPFGGFFASGFKRAFKIKDFGNSIPGHGGVTD